MTQRIWLAIVVAPLVGAIAYACLTIASLPSVAIPERPTLFSLVASGAIAGLIFEVAVLVPVFLALRRWRVHGVSLVLLGSLAWFAICLLFMLSVGAGLSEATATATQMLLPGITLVIAFWVLWPFSRVMIRAIWQAENRITGVLIAGFSIYFGYLFGRAVLDMNAEFATFMAKVAAMQGGSMDVANFLLHWRIGYATMSFLAGLGFVAGLAMVLLKRWSWMLVGGIALATVLLSLLGMVTGYSRYGFEHVALIELAPFVLVASVALFAYCRWDRTDGNDSNN